MADGVEVPEHHHEPPKAAPIPGPWILVPFGALIVSGLVYGFRVGADGLVELVFPDPRFSVAEAKFCTYYHLARPLTAGQRARIRIAGNEENPPAYGAVEIFVTPQGDPLPPAGTPAPSPRTTFGGNGEATVNGPGVVSVHLKTNTHPPRIEVWFEDTPR